MTYGGEYMYSSKGEIDGIKWVGKYLGGRNFVLFVGSLKEDFTCSYEPIFGVDAGDYASMNKRMDKMQERILKENLPKSNDELEKEYKSL